MSSTTAAAIAAAFQHRVERFGYRKTTVDEVAADLGISKKTIYAHFASKAEIYQHVVAGIAAETSAQLLASVASLPTAGARIEAATRTILRMARAHIAETDRAEWEAEFTVATDAFREALGSVIRQLVQDGIDAGELAVEDAGLAARLLGALLVEYSIALREDPGQDMDEAVVAAVRRFVG